MFKNDFINYFGMTHDPLLNILMEMEAACREKRTDESRSGYEVVRRPHCRHFDFDHEPDPEDLASCLSGTKKKKTSEHGRHTADNEPKPHHIFKVFVEDDLPTKDYEYTNGRSNMKSPSSKKPEGEDICENIKDRDFFDLMRAVVGDFLRASEVAKMEEDEANENNDASNIRGTEKNDKSECNEYCCDEELLIDDSDSEEYALDDFVDVILRYGPTTEVRWKDGTRTRVRRMKGEKEDPYAAFCAAFAKRVYGSSIKIHEMVDEKTEIIVDPMIKKKKRKKKLEDPELPEGSESKDE